MIRAIASSLIISAVVACTDHKLRRRRAALAQQLVAFGHRLTALDMCEGVFCGLREKKCAGITAAQSREPDTPALRVRGLHLAGVYI